MIRLAIFLITCLSLVSCVTTDNAIDTLTYAGTNERVNISKVDFQGLKRMKQGKSCMYKFLGIPILGDLSVEEAAYDQNISEVQLRAKTGLWVFPIYKECTLVYGDANPLPVRK